MHVHHLNTGSGKMSKSKGEFLTVSLLEEKGYDPLVYRFFCMQSHYRKNLVFTWENLDNAKAAYDKFIARVAALNANAQDEIDTEAFAIGKKKFTDALDNDLNTSLAVTAIYDVLKLRTNDKTKLALIEDFERVLSLGIMDAANKIKAKEAAEKAEENAGVDPELLAYITTKIEERKNAKKARDFALADAIRDELLSKGITLLDTREGTKFTIEQ
jgi:cysteinyl-tRNA synthetase